MIPSDGSAEDVGVRAGRFYFMGYGWHCFVNALISIVRVERREKWEVTEHFPPGWNGDGWHCFVNALISIVRVETREKWEVTEHFPPGWNGDGGHCFVNALISNVRVGNAGKSGK